MSCTRPVACAAVGWDDIGLCADEYESDYSVPVLGFWTSARWSLRRHPNLGCSSSSDNGGGTGLNAVSCTSTTACTAVGTAVYRWDGRDWSIQPARIGADELYGVSCTSTNACTAVGSRIYTWNGREWSSVPIPGRPTRRARGLGSVVMHGHAVRAWPSGGYRRRPGPDHSLVESTGIGDDGGETGTASQRGIGAMNMPTPTNTNRATSAHSGIGYYAGLDGIRALAIVAVLLYHGGVVWAAGGFLGVEAFFVLSGFLITSLLIAEWRRSATIALACVLGEARAATPSRPVLHGRGRGPLRGARVDWRLAARPQGRRNRDPLLLRQLARDRDPVQLLRRDRSGIAAPAHLVTGDRGAVLHPLARRRCWPRSGSRVAFCAGAGRPTGACWGRCWRSA